MSIPKNNIIIPSSVSVFKLQNYSSQCSNCGFFRKIEEKLFWVIKAINEASATNSFMNFSHTLYAVADAKALCSILYGFGNIQIKYSLSWQKPQYSEGSKKKKGREWVCMELGHLNKNFVKTTRGPAGKSV